MTETLLGYLARFGALSSQGEVLCTQGLNFLLGAHSDAREAFEAELTARTGVELPRDLVWRAERMQADGARPDLEASSNHIAYVKVEAKLDAPFDPNQLHSYVADLQRHLVGTDRVGMLAVLVPRLRVQGASETVRTVFDVAGDPPWRYDLGSRPVVIAVLTWDDVLASLERADSQPLSAELTQFEGMYRTLTGTYVAPLAGIDALLDWRTHEHDFKRLVDQVTRALTPGRRVLPMYQEPLDESLDELELRPYTLRYVCRANVAGKESCFSIGLRDPFASSETPIWMRFHSATGRYPEIRSRLESSALAPCLVASGGHIWIPLEIPLQATSEEMVASLVAQADKVQAIAYAGMT